MRISQEKVLEAFISVMDGDPFYRAMNQVITDQIESEVLNSIQPDLSDSGRAYNCGRAAAMKDLHEYFNTLRNTNRLTDQPN
jgi:hypothetical protein